MSLTSFVAESHIRKSIDLIIPKFSRIPPHEIFVESKTQHPAILGTAYDYAVRLELHRYCPHAFHRVWVAEQGVDSMKSGRLKDRAHTIVKQARSCTRQILTREHFRKKIAVHALRLARLDAVYRAGIEDETVVTSPGADEVTELLKLIDITRFSDLTHKTFISLNPTFGRWSNRVGGADADLISGDRLIDFKTSAKLEIRPAMIRQLVGYFMLSRFARDEGEDLPNLDSLELHFPRFDFAFSIPTRLLLINPDFDGVERSFRASILKYYK